MTRLSSPLRLTAGLWRPIAAWIGNADARRKLADMPDYLLKDIGLRRDQIAAAFDGSLVADAARAEPAAVRAAAQVVAFSRNRSSRKPAPPRKPMAA